MPNDKPLSPQGYNIGVDPINTNPFFDGVPGGGGGEGATAYNQLTGRPFINGKVLEGNKDLKLVTPEELQAAKTELTSSVTQEEEARIAEDAAIRQEIEAISLTPGPPGNDGAPGVAGKAATIRVGATETVEPGTPASVTNSGTENAAVLTFKIPRGNTGAVGPAGADGAPGKDFTYEDFTPEQLEALRGPQGIQGVPGSDGAPGVAGRIESVSAETVPYTEEASVQNTGTEENAILHFKIPQGIPGTSGGAGGATVTVNVGTTTTGEPGTNAEVTNRGTEENVVLDFKIPRGNTGAPGVDGKDGAPGKDFTYDDFTSEQLEALRGPQGIQGVPGSDGAPGVDGKAATIKVGGTETLEPDSVASVVNSGTENAAVLTFKIPRGNTGARGADGTPGKDFTYEDFTPEQLEALRGPQGIQGVPGSDGAPGVAGKAATIRVGATETVEPGTPASVTNSGTENAAVLTFKIPKGNTGAPGADGTPGKDFTYDDFTPEQLEALRGPQGLQGAPGSDGAPGVDGKSATIRVGTVTTLPAGSDATVTNSGTENAAIFNFGIPQGIQGEPGSGGGGGGAIMASRKTQSMNFSGATASEITGGWRITVDASAAVNDVLDNRLVLAVTGNYVAGSYVNFNVIWAGGTDGSQLIFDSQKNVYALVRIYRSGFSGSRILNVEVTGVTGTIAPPSSAVSGTFYVQWLSVDSNAGTYSARAAAKDEKIILRDGE